MVTSANKNVTTFAEAYQYALHEQQFKSDQLVPVSAIRFPNIGEAEIYGIRFPMQVQAQRQICSRMRVPHEYMSRCPADLQQPHLEYWFETEKNDRLFFRFYNRTVRAIFTPRYAPFDDVDMFKSIESIVKPETPVVYRFDPAYTKLAILDYDHAISIRENDKSIVGYGFYNSEVGLSSFGFEKCMLRLVCTNGLVLPEWNRFASYRHISRDVKDLSQHFNITREELDRVNSHYRFTLESKVPHPDETFENLNKRFALSERQAEAVSWAWPLEWGDTMYNVVQTYTRAAQYPEFSTIESHQMERIGGKVLALLGEGRGI